MTRHVAYAEFSKNLDKYMDEAGAEPLRVERSEGSVVVMSEQDFEGWMETVHLLSNPANAKRLLEAIDDANAGKLTEHELIEE